jgi:DNA repair protein RadD
MSFILRDYQQEAIDALNNHICTRKDNPCVCIPTGGGKSVIIAESIRRWQAEYPPFRCCVLAHRKELVQQNSDKLRAIEPDLSVGIFSAALNHRDYDSPILFASIDSIYKRAGEFKPFDVLMVDEAHRIPPKGEGKYRTFIAECQKFNPNLRVVGWTATPFRMGCGPICHSDHILNLICYNAGITDLIEKGFLSRLRSKVGVSKPDLTDVKRNSGGDYITKSLAEATNKVELVKGAVAEAVRILNEERRRSILFFCVDVEHGEAVEKELRSHGITAPLVTGTTKQHDRDSIAKRLQNGKLRAVCSINVFTEGFDAPNIDGIVLLRPTLSKGLFAQMVGRGLRIATGKQDCLVLDFAGCIEQHGPLDLLDGGYVALAVCGECRESFSRALGRCPHCGWVIPKREVERLESVERERRMHSTRASNKSILSNEPETHKVNAVYVSRHRKSGSPDSVCVQYRCGVSIFREWVTLDHPDFAGRKAQSWWVKRFGRQQSAVTVDEALSDLFLSQSLLEWTKTVTVKRNGKYFEVVGYNAEAS